MVKKKKQAIKSLNLRLREETWEFIRNQAFDQKLSINELINVCLEKTKKSYEKALTSAKNVIL